MDDKVLNEDELNMVEKSDFFVTSFACKLLYMCRECIISVTRRFV